MAQESLKENTRKLVKAHARHLRIAPRKIRLVTNLIKNLNVNDAMVQLQHMPKKAAPMVARLVKSAIANAKNNFSLDADHLFIKSITTDMGRAMKRYFPRARGSAFVIRRKMAHVNLVLEERKQGKAAKSRISLFKKKEESAPENVDKLEAVNKQEVKDHKEKFTVKTDEQRKMNLTANKRRLFNRKSGE